jgi:hypothetical protein
MLRRWMVGGLSVFLLASALLAKPGVVTNRQGETFNGDVTEDDKFVYINGAGGQIKLDKRNIASVVYAETIDDQYASRHAKLAANDVKGRIDLAQWANDNNRADLAVAALTEARKIDPMNKDAARALDAAQQQLDMDQAAAKAKPVKPTTAPAMATTTASAPAPTTQQVTAGPPPERRLLNNDEINIIRQKEMQPDDPAVRVMFANNVIKRYLAGGDHNLADFNKMSKEAQAIDILTHGDPALAKDVRISTDPTPLMDFKKKVYPIISSGCASSACHGGTKARDFVLYPGDSNQAVYTNFYILLNYSTTVGGVKYLALDRDVPDRSLVLQFGLAHADANPPHPKVPGLRVLFKGQTDPKYDTIYQWMTKSLTVLQPDYGFRIAASVGAPTSQPAAASTGSPTTAPAKPTVPASPKKNETPGLPGMPPAPK